MKALVFFALFGLIFVLSFYCSSNLFAQASSTAATSDTAIPQLPSDADEEQKELTASGAPTYIEYIDPQTGEKKQKKVYYGFQYKKTDKDAKPIGNKQYSPPNAEGGGGVGRRWGWQYPGAAKVKMSTSTKQKAPGFQKVVRSPIQVDGDPTGTTSTKTGKKNKKSPKMTPESIQKQILEMAKKQRQGK